MNFGQIIKRSWQLICKYRFLWWLGILALFTESGFASLPNLNLYGFGNAFSQPEQPSNFTPSDASHILGASTQNFWSNYAILILLGTVLILILVIVILYLSYCAKAGLILAVENYETENKPYNFKIAFCKGKLFFWRLFGLNLLIGLFLFLTFLVLASPVVIALVISRALPVLALVVGYGILAAIFSIVLVVYLTIALKLAERIIVLENKRVSAAIEQARHLVRIQLGNSLLAWLINLGIALGYVFGLSIALLFVGGILLGLGLIIYFIAKIWAAAIFAGIAVIALAMALLFVNGIFTAFISSYWTLSYKALQKLAK